MLVAAVLLATVGLPKRPYPTTLEPLNDSIVGESYDVETNAPAEADKDAGQHKIRAEAPGQAPPGIVVDEKPEVSAEQLLWTENVYRHPEASVKADRYRFLLIDWDAFYEELEKTQAYLAASSGRTPPPVYDDTPPTFRFAAFEDRSLDLLITEVQFEGDPGSKHIVMDGHVVGTDDGTFRLSTTEGQKNLTGRIETPDLIIRVDTFANSGFTTVAEFGREAIEKSAHVPMDFVVD